ncbi:MAG: hypothetical protein U1A27_04465 [Phycisphaerae bacterium]
MIRTAAFLTAMLVTLSAPLAGAFQAPSTARSEAVSGAEALDRPVGSLKLEAQALPAVLETLAQKAGVHFVVDEDTYAVLPWGRETRVASLTLSAGATLRATLDEVLRPLGLVYRLEDDARRTIRVDSSPPLDRMNRRATWDDLRLLTMLETTPYSAANLGQVRIQYKITTKVNAPQSLANQLKRSGEGTLAQMLTTATNALGWTWYPDGDHVVVLSQEALNNHNLARTVTARYNQMNLAHILLDLSQKADVPFSFEPGLMLKLPATAANSYSLMLNQTSIREALEFICAETGLKYIVRRDAVDFSLAPGAVGVGSGGAARSRGDPYVARILVPARNGNYTYEFLIRDSELPDDLREYRGQMIDEMIDRIRQDMAPSSESPTSQKS